MRGIWMTLCLFVVLGLLIGCKSPSETRDESVDSASGKQTPATEEGETEAVQEASPPDATTEPGDEAANPTPPIEMVFKAEGYDETCTADADCVALNVVGHCGCPRLCSVAVRATEKDKVEADWKAWDAACGDQRDEGFCMKASPCPPPKGATCQEGKCAVVSE